MDRVQRHVTDEDANRQGEPKTACGCKGGSDERRYNGALLQLQKMTHKYHTIIENDTKNVIQL